MKKTLTLILALSGSSVALAAEQADYIPWTFDDFNSNCEVVDGPLNRVSADAEDAGNSAADPGRALDG